MDGDMTASRDDCLDLTLSSDPIAVRKALTRLQRRLLQTGVEPDAAGRVELVLAEVLNNVVEHALAGKKGGLIRLNLDKVNEKISVEVTDEGAPFQGSELPEGQMPDAGDVPEGGFGWPIIHALTEDLAYDRIGERNILRFSVPLRDAKA